MSIEFRPSPIHGLGGFAPEPIPAGRPIIEYIGQRIGKREALRQCELNNPFIFYLDGETDLNGDVPWNPARFLNHSCAPNSQAELLNGQIWIVATRQIAVGEEITFNYGYDLESYRAYPCQCGALDCVGFMLAEEFHERIRRSREL